MVVIVAMMVVMMAAARVRAVFRIERCLDHRDRSTKKPDHIFDDMIAADQDAIRQQHDRQMAITEMPGNTHEIGRRCRRDFRKLFFCRHYPNSAAVFQQERIALSNPMRTRQIEQKFKSIFSRHRQTTAMPIVEIERYLIIDQPVTSALGLACNGTKHRSPQNRK